MTETAEQPTAVEQVDQPAETQPLPQELPAAEPAADGIALREVVASLRELSAELQAHGQQARETADRLAENEADQAEQRRTREALLDKLDASRSSFQFQQVRPLAQRLASVCDLARDWQAHPPKDADGFAQCLNMLLTQVRDLLEMQGIEEIRPQPDEPFDRRFHHVVETRPTGELGRHERIAQVLQHGFVYFGQHERTAALTPNVIRPARVVTWKHDASLQLSAAAVETGPDGEAPK